MTSLTVSSSTDVMFIRAAERFMATAGFDDGTRAGVPAAWSSDAPGVATVGPDGTVTGLANGEVSIIADFQGIRASRRIRVMPDYGGTWHATRRNVSCVEAGDWAVGVCEDQDHVNRFTVNVTFVQDRESAAGQITVYSDIPTVPTQGTIGQDGHMLASGSVPYTHPNCDRPCLFELIDWNIVSTDSFSFSGQYTIRVTSPDHRGFRSWTAEISGTKIAAAANAEFPLHTVPVGRASSILAAPR